MFHYQRSITCSLRLIAQNISNTNTSNNVQIVDDEDHDPLEYAGGEFDADESAEIIQAAGVSKAKVGVHGVRIVTIYSK